MGFLASFWFCVVNFGCDKFANNQFSKKHTIFVSNLKLARIEKRTFLTGNFFRHVFATQDGVTEF